VSRAGEGDEHETSYKGRTWGVTNEVVERKGAIHLAGGKARTSGDVCGRKNRPQRRGQHHTGRKRSLSETLDFDETGNQNMRTGRRVWDKGWLISRISACLSLTDGEFSLKRNASF